MRRARVAELLSLREEWGMASPLHARYMTVTGELTGGVGHDVSDGEDARLPDELQLVVDHYRLPEAPRLDDGRGLEAGGVGLDADAPVHKGHRDPGEITVRSR